MQKSGQMQHIQKESVKREREWEYSELVDWTAVLKYTKILMFSQFGPENKR